MYTRRVWVKLSVNPIVFAPFLYRYPRIAHRFCNTVCWWDGWEGTTIFSRVDPPLHSLDVNHWDLISTIFPPRPHVARRGKLMYRMYITAAGRQAKIPCALASSAFGRVSNWTHLTGGEGASGEDSKELESGKKYSLENGKSTPSRRNYMGQSSTSPPLTYIYIYIYTLKCCRPTI